jgi:triosephosphate isomerase
VDGIGRHNEVYTFSIFGISKFHNNLFSLCIFSKKVKQSMIRKKIAAGNWKMHTSIDEGAKLVDALIAGLNTQNAEIIVAPPFTHLQPLNMLRKGSGIRLAAQNCHEAAKGAFTGEVSVSMLESAGADVVILGHSERREIFNENNTRIKSKVDAVLSAGMDVIFCCGESLETREAGKAQEFVESQLNESLFHLSEEMMKRVIIAYEPIWAIGTGVTASPGQAQEMHAFIRGLLINRYNDQTAQKTRILYGGSVKPDNAATLFGQIDVDGGLVGGASLKAEDFLAIIEAAG